MCQAQGQAPGMQREEDRVPGFKDLSLVGDLSAAWVLRDTQKTSGRIRAHNSALRNARVSERGESSD